MSPKDDYEEIVRRMVEAVGHTTQSMGIGRVLGQIFAYLYFTPDPRSLDDLTSALGISKGSASMGVRQLEQWGALEKVWIKGDRKDYYIATDALGSIIKNILADLAGKRMENSARLINQTAANLEEHDDSDETMDENDRFIAERVSKIQAFQKKVQEMWNSGVVKILLR
ncbi:MAG: hypothetical protein R6V03_03795 [Kiritimatiellia bacterium]